MLIWLHPTHSRAGIRAALRRLEAPERITWVYYDGDEKIAAAVRDVLPWATLVVDLPHWQRRVDKAQRRARRVLLRGIPIRLDSPGGEGRRRERINTLLETPPERLSAAQRALRESVLADPLMRAVHETYWRLRRLGGCRTRRQAEQEMASLQDLPADVAQFFAKQLARLRGPAGEAFLANFDAPRLTNNRTESYNRRVKEMRAEGRGKMAFAALRLKALVRLGPIGEAEVRRAARAIAGRHLGGGGTG